MDSGLRQPSTPLEAERVAPPPANDDRKPAMAKPALVTTSRKRHSVTDRLHLPMEVPLSRKPVERDGAVLCDGRLRTFCCSQGQPSNRSDSCCVCEAPTQEKRECRTRLGPALVSRP
jgi:hypothetical protein